MPIDAEPVWILREPGGKPYFLKSGEMITGRQIGDAYDNPEDLRDVYEVHASHFATCPNADAHRRRG